MTRYEEITKEWRKDISAFADSTEVLYSHRGAVMFGVCQAYYSPDSRPFYFKCDKYGFRHPITNEELNQLVNKISQ